MMRRALLTCVAVMLVVGLGVGSVRAVQGDHQASRFEQDGEDEISPLVLPVARIGGNLREQPTTQSNRIEMPSGIATFEVLGDQVSELSGGTANGSNLWYHIRVGDGQEAYVHSSVVSIDQAEVRAIQLYEAYLANLYLFEEQPRIVRSGQLPGSLVAITEPAGTILYPELVEPVREALGADLDDQGIEAAIATITNRLAGQDFRYTLLPFTANPDGSTTVYWPLAPDGTLNWNPVFGTQGEFASITTPPGLQLAGGFSDTTTDGIPENVYLAVTLNCTPVAGIDLATKSLEPLSSFSPEQQQLIAQALAGQLEPADLAESLHLLKQSYLEELFTCYPGEPLVLDAEQLQALNEYYQTHNRQENRGYVSAMWTQLRDPQTGVEPNVMFASAIPGFTFDGINLELFNASLVTAGLSLPEEPVTVVEFRDLANRREIAAPLSYFQRSQVHEYARPRTSYGETRARIYLATSYMRRIASEILPGSEASSLDGSIWALSLGALKLIPNPNMMGGANDLAIKPILDAGYNQQPLNQLYHEIQVSFEGR